MPLLFSPIARRRAAALRGDEPAEALAALRRRLWVARARDWGLLDETHEAPPVVRREG